MNEVFNFQLEYFNKKNLIVNGKTMYYMTQQFLLESTFQKSYQKEHILNTWFAIDYMKKKPFYISDFGYDLREYEKYLINIHQIPKDEFELYKKNHFSY